MHKGDKYSKNNFGDFIGPIFNFLNINLNDDENQFSIKFYLIFVS